MFDREPRKKTTDTFACFTILTSVHTFNLIRQMLSGLLVNFWYLVSYHVEMVQYWFPPKKCTVTPPPPSENNIFSPCNGHDMTWERHSYDHRLRIVSAEYDRELRKKTTDTLASFTIFTHTYILIRQIGSLVFGLFWYLAMVQNQLLDWHNEALLTLTFAK